MMLRASLIAASAVLASVGQATAGLVYSNGQINGEAYAYTINRGISVTDSFTVSAPTNLATAQIGLWLYHGDVPLGVDWQIGTAPYGYNVSYGASGLSNAFQYTNGDGYDVYESTFSLSGALNPGTYWLTLYNAESWYGNYVYWDKNQGPSTAFQFYNGNSVGIASESFQLNDASTVATPAPASLSLLGIGTAIIIGHGWRRRHRPMPA
jgi:hypothetical protein